MQGRVIGYANLPQHDPCAVATATGTLSRGVAVNARRPEAAGEPSEARPGVWRPCPPRPSASFAQKHMHEFYAIPQDAAAP